MPPVNIPIEILEHFVDHIPIETREGRISLRSCLLVSKLLFYRSRNRLFEYVELQGRTNKTASLRKLLEEERDTPKRTIGYPSLARCIKSLKIVWPPHAFNTDRFQPDDDISVILSLLAKTQALRALDLYFTYTTDFPHLCEALHIYEAILGICSSPCFEHLTLQHLWAVPQASFDLWKIKKLTLTDVTFLDNYNPLSPSLSADSNDMAEIAHGVYTDPQLRVLCIFRPWLPSKIFQCPSPFSQLHTITVKFDTLLPRNPSPLFDNLLSVSSNTLQTLNIHLGESGSALRNYPHSLQQLTSLRILSFMVELRWRSPADDIELETEFNPFMVLAGMKDVVESLSTIASAPPTLNLIEVVFRICLKHKTGVGFVNEAEWRDLGHVLTDMRFSSVKKIEVVVEAVMCDVDPKEVPFLEDFPRRWKESYPSISLRECY